MCQTAAKQRRGTLVITWAGYTCCKTQGRKPMYSKRTGRDPAGAAASRDSLIVQPGITIFRWVLVARSVGRKNRDNMFYKAPRAPGCRPDRHLSLKQRWFGPHRSRCYRRAISNQAGGEPPAWSSKQVAAPSCNQISPTSECNRNSRRSDHKANETRRTGSKKDTLV